MRDVPKGSLGRDNREHANDRFALLMSLALYGQTPPSGPAGQRPRTRRVHARTHALGGEPLRQPRDYPRSRERAPDTL